MWILWALLVVITAATMINNHFWAARTEKRWPMVTAATLIWFGSTSGLALWVAQRIGGEVWLWISLTVAVQFAGLLAAGVATMAGIYFDLARPSELRRQVEGLLVEEIVHLQLQREDLRQALRSGKLTAPERAFQMEGLYVLTKVMDDSGLLNAIIEEIQVQLMTLKLMLEHISSDPTEPLSMQELRAQAEEIIHGGD